MRPSVDEQHAVAGVEHALGPLLGDDDRAHRCATRELEQRLAAPSGSSCEVGSSSSSKPRLERERRGEADALQLAARELGDRALGEMRGADRGERLRRTRQRSRAGGAPRFSSPNATSLFTRVNTTWSSGSWKSVATVPASSAGARGACRSPPTSTDPEKRPP